MKVWMYYETDGDAGYYAIKLFFTKTAAEKYKREKNDAYGHVDSIFIKQYERVNK